MILQRILENRYKDLIMNAVKLLTSKKYNIEFFILSEEVAEIETPKAKREAKEII